NALLLLFKEKQTARDGSAYDEIFFVQQRDPARERWTGKRLGAAGVTSELGISPTLDGTKFSSFGINGGSVTKLIRANWPSYSTNNKTNTADLYELIEAFKAKMKPLSLISDTRLFGQITGRLREIKTAEEMVLIRKAVEISCYAQNEVMRTIRGDMSELEIQGLHEYVHKKYGAESVGYGSIIGSGENGCTLHYTENSKTRIGNDLVLMDVGAEYHGYTADVTRTIPADGRFSEQEKAIYELVYNAQEAAFKILRNGAEISIASRAAFDVIADGLLHLGIIKTRTEAHKYYPHGLSHPLGLDVHDRAVSSRLKTGMVITIEPGIYIPFGSACDKKWWGIAVRIEDDVLIRENDYELLSVFSPRSVSAIEKLIAEKSVLDDFILPRLQSQKKAF
ncbi:MAG: M24 family metallopeptidase, partial [Chitinophagaceae bacterium]